MQQRGRGSSHAFHYTTIGKTQHTILRQQIYFLVIILIIFWQEQIKLHAFLANNKIQKLMWLRHRSKTKWCFVLFWERGAHCEACKNEDPNHWTAREFPLTVILSDNSCCLMKSATFQVALYK